MAPDTTDTGVQPLELSFQSFRATDTSACFRQAAAALGDDAVVLRTVIHREADPVARAEIIAAPAAAVESFRRRITPVPIARRGRDAVRDSGPLVIALAGPAGSGKSTMAARLACHEGAFGGWRTGIITLDTRPGALERSNSHAHTVGVPLEVVYEPGQVTGAMRRLMKARCDVVIVDTPGQSPRADALAQRWSASLRTLRPDEVHLVMPATQRADLAAYTRAAATSLGVTHALITKLDELPANEGLAELAAALALPVRWVGEGQDVRADLRDGAQRVLGALGVPASVSVRRTRAAAAAQVGGMGSAPSPEAPAAPPGAFSFLTRRRSIAASR